MFISESSMCDVYMYVTCIYVYVCVHFFDIQKEGALAIRYNSALESLSRARCTY